MKCDALVSLPPATATLAGCWLAACVPSKLLPLLWLCTEIACCLQAVALGAAVQAGILEGQVSDVMVLDVWKASLMRAFAKQRLRQDQQLAEEAGLAPDQLQDSDDDEVCRQDMHAWLLELFPALSLLTVNRECNVAVIVGMCVQPLGLQCWTAAEFKA